jgi:hypothetical protein
MRITLELPDNIQSLPDEEQKKQILEAFRIWLEDRNMQAAQGENKRSKWADIAKRVENDPVHLGGYSEQFKRDMKEFRDNFEFRHDLH